MNQILSIKFGYDSNAGSSIAALSDDDYVALCERLPELHLKPVAERESDESLKWNVWEFVGVLDDVEYLTKLGITCSISRVRGVFADQLAGQETFWGKSRERDTINNIVIPNVSLFAVRKLKVLENECTDEVQSWLDQGWRIVAVCPPNDTRRPTYILGHMGEQA